MLKKFICIMLSIFILTLSVGTVGFAADYTKGAVSASHVTFTADGGASVTVSSTEDGGKAVFWLGEYIDGVLVESDFAVLEPEKGNSATANLSITKDSDSILKAYVWEDILYGSAIAPVATYPSSSTEILYATANGGVWKEFEEYFKADTFEYSMELSRDVLKIPEFKLYAKDNSTQIIEPENYATGENKVKIIAQDGTTKEYVLNLSYTKPEFKNFTSPMLSTSEIRCVPNISLTGANYTSMLELYGKAGVEGTTAYKTYPSYTASSQSLNNPGVITSYLNSLGHTEGNLFVFRSSKGPNNDSAWYAGGVGTYDGTNGNYFLTFDVELPGTMYLVLVEGKTDAHIRNFVKAGFAPISSGSNVYKKHYEAGETVKVPAMGWDESAWGKPEEAGSGRKYKDSTYFMFGYDDITAPPVAYDASDVTLKKLSYTVAGESISVPGWSASDKGGVYEVLLPTGTTAVDMVDAVKNEGFSELACDKSGKIELQNGKAEVVITVTAKDGSQAVYTINFTEKAPAPDNADLKEITYTVGGESFVIQNFNPDVLTYNAQLAPFTDAVEVSAVAAVGNDKATVSIIQPVIENKKGAAIITVTSIDASTTKTYTVEFDVALHISEMPNKVYNLTSVDSYKTENNGYQTEAEATTTPKLIVIGENLSASSFKYNTHIGTHKFTVTDDMLGATYIRTKRNHTDYKEVKSYSAVTRTVEGNTPSTGNLWNGSTSSTGYGFRTNATLEKPFYAGAYSAQNGEPGYIEFYVTSDCTVVVGDSVDSGWPNLDKTKWTKSDKITNKINGISYYRTYKAGDLVQIPNYGIGGKLADNTKVTYSYTDVNGEAQTYETTVGKDLFVWDEIVVAIKWDVTISDDATLSDISANGQTIKGFDKAVTEYTIEVPKGESVVLKAVASHGAATVEPNDEVTITAGNSQSFTVTAESGKTCVYTVTVNEEKQAIKLTELKYTLNDILTYDVDTAQESFDINIPSNTEKIALVAKLSDNSVVDIKDLAIENGVATANISASNETVCTVCFTLSNVPFTNVISMDSGVKDNIYKVINAVAEGIQAQSIKPANTAEINQKKAEYQARFDAVEAKYGKNAHRGSGVYSGYPTISAYSTGVSIDNPGNFGIGSDSAEIINGNSWVLQVAKGGTPTEANGGWSFGTNTEFLKFDVLKPGTLYIVDTGNGLGGQGYLDAGFVKSETKSLVGRKVYEKHFEAGTVVVPAQGAKNLTLGTRIPNTNGYVFMFDDEEIQEPEDITLTELKYTLNDVITYNMDTEAGLFNASVPSNTEKITLIAKLSDNSTVEIKNIAIKNGSATANVKSESGKDICTVRFTLSGVPFANVISVDTGIKDNIYKVINAVAEGIYAQSVKPSGNAEMNEKKAEYQARFDAVEAKYGENAYFGASVYAGYPKLLAYSTAVSIDNPAYFGMGSDALEIINGNSWVLQTAKGGTPTEENGGWSFGTNKEFLKFDVLKPGTLYIVDSNNGYGGQGYLDAGFVKSETQNLVGRKVYEKHFEAGTVIVPAQGAKNLTLGTRITTSNGYVFMFDKETVILPDYKGIEDGGDL